MAALPQGTGQVVDVIAAHPGRRRPPAVHARPGQARRGSRTRSSRPRARRLFDPAELRASADAACRAAAPARGGPPPRPARVVRSAAHLALAREVAERSITLVRDRRRPAAAPPGPGIAGPRRDAAPPGSSRRPTPPTRSRRASRPRCASAWPDVDEIVTSHPPTDDEIAAVRRAGARRGGRRRRDDRRVRGPRAGPARRGAARHRAARRHRRAAHAVGPRARTRAARTHVAAYGILPPTLAALAAALFGAIPFQGRLPVATAVPA